MIKWCQGGHATIGNTLWTNTMIRQDAWHAMFGGACIGRFLVGRKHSWARANGCVAHVG